MTSQPTLTPTKPKVIYQRRKQVTTPRADAALNANVAASVQAGTLGQPVLSYGGRGGGRFDAFLLGYQDNRLPISPWWSEVRDRELRRYVRESVIVSGLAYSRANQVQNLEWDIVVNDKTLEPYVDHYVEMFQQAQFQEGWRTFINNWVLDYHTQDNGAFIELIGAPSWEFQQPYQDEFGNKFIATSPLGGVEAWDTPAVAAAKTKAAIQGIAHLDAGCAWRTANPEFPVVYRNAYKGYFVLLHRSRVVAASQFRQASELSRGIGYCAASRGLQAAEMLQAMHDYNYEKLTGASPAIGLLKGVPMQAVKQAIQDNAIEMDNKGLVRWRGAALIQGDSIPGIDPDIKIIDIKDTPDGFDHETEFTLNLYLLSVAWGTDLRDMGWSKGSQGSTKADAEVQDAKSSGRGREDAIGALEEKFNTRILPKGLEFKFKIKDDLEDHRKAEIQRMRAEARSIRITSGELSAAEAREIAAQEGDLPSEFMVTQTVVPGQGNLSDDPLSPVDQPGMQQAAPTVVLATPSQTLANEGQKSLDTYVRLLTSIIDQYRKGHISKAQFKTQMRGVITKQFALAWAAGAKEVGESPYTPEGQAELVRLIDEEYQYVQQFADAVAQIKAFGEKVTLKDIRNRIKIWANQFNRIKNRALMFLGGDKRLIWLFGDTVHCMDCFLLDEHVMTAREWAKKNVQPQDRQLECGGWNCKCKLQVTEKPLSRKPFPLDMKPLAGVEEVL